MDNGTDVLTTRRPENLTARRNSPHRAQPSAGRVVSAAVRAPASTPVRAKGPRFADSHYHKGPCGKCGGEMGTKHHFARLNLLEHVGLGLCRGCARGTVVTQAAVLSVITVADQRWQRRAVCHNEPTNTFYVPDGMRGPRVKEATNRALSICADCPVRAQCLEYAMRTGDDSAVLGGTTPKQRRAMRAASRSARPQATG